jgi:hypothetical protein
VLTNLVLPKLHHDRPLRKQSCILVVAISMCIPSLTLYHGMWWLAFQCMRNVKSSSWYEWDVAASTGTQLQYVTFYLNCGSCQQPSTLFIVCIASHFSSCTEIEFATGRVFVPVPTVLYNVVIHSCWQKSHKSHLQVFAGLTWAARKNSNLHNICW